MIIHHCRLDDSVFCHAFGKLMINPNEGKGKYDGCRSLMQGSRCCIDCFRRERLMKRLLLLVLFPAMTAAADDEPGGIANPGFENGREMWIFETGNVRMYPTSGLESFRLTEKLSPGVWYRKTVAPGRENAAARKVRCHSE